MSRLREYLERARPPEPTIAGDRLTVVPAIASSIPPNGIDTGDSKTAADTATVSPPAVDVDPFPPVSYPPEAPTLDPDALVGALEDAARALWRAHAAGVEAGIEAAWRRYQDCNTQYAAWSRALRFTDPETARHSDLLVAGRLRAIKKEAS